MDNRTGKTGEDFVVQLLEKKGHMILATNYHSRFGEIDIISGYNNFLIFTEVKTRKKNSISSPFDAVTASKQKKIILTAGQYIVENQFQLQPRFDVAAVTTDNGEILDVKFIENAFMT